MSLKFHGKYFVGVYAEKKDSSNKIIYVPNLTVYYKHYQSYKNPNKPLGKFSQMTSKTSAAIDLMLPGLYKMWLVDEFAKGAPVVAGPVEVNLDEDDFINDKYHGKDDFMPTKIILRR